jgi:hypothetical protein
MKNCRLKRPFKFHAFKSFKALHTASTKLLPEYTSHLHRLELELLLLAIKSANMVMPLFPHSGLISLSIIFDAVALADNSGRNSYYMIQ